ncbi:M20/M25/M40 family metallo-hydrolase [Actinoplanes sp. NPDC049596]|uniref:M20 metallopeptidase family protein n=1 Tax=unclassified Actinoplanes TaxID=2626549 RepID=UPI003431BFA9
MPHNINRRVFLGGAAAAGVAAALPSPALASPADLIALRRDLHAHPEAPGQEQRTAAVVARRLRAAGLDVTTGVGGHGVVTVVRGDRPGRTVAYRADMDAVPPEDQIEGPGPTAHICGHDLHTTIGVGIATGLARRPSFAGAVVFLFQPAEESLTGAAAMLADGVLERYRPTEIHALHCGPFPVGHFAVTPGTGLPGQDLGAITLPSPAAASDVADKINSLSTVARPATGADLERLVADIQKPDGPLARYVFAQARATGNQVQFAYRCWPASRHAAIRDRIRDLAQAPVTFPTDPFPAMVCPRPQALALKRHLQQHLGRDRVRTVHAAIPFNGEDFALFLNRLPGTYTFLGVRRPGAPIKASYPHFNAFDPDERAISHGVRAMSSWLTTRAAAV